MFHWVFLLIAGVWNVSMYFFVCLRQSASICTRIIFLFFVFIWFKCAKCIKLWSYLIDRLMNWTEDGSVIESTKQIMTEQKYTFQRKNVQQYEFRREKKRCEKLLVCNGLVRIHQWNEEKVENCIFNAISYRLLIQCRNFLICLRCLRFWSRFEFSFGISTIASRLGLGIGISHFPIESTALSSNIYIFFV